MLSITGGFLFGAIWGTVHIVLSATLGATLLFLIAKTSLGNLLRATAGVVAKDAGRVQENALSYLLVLRLVPLFPFFVVNLVPAFLGVALSTYILGTFIGIIPGAFVYASVGAGTREPLRCWRGIQCQRHPDATDPRGAYWLGSFSPDAGRV